MTQPTLESNRLLMRPFSQTDANRVRELAGEYEVARYTEAVPHPYEEGEAERWIACQSEEFSRGTGATFAITLKENGSLLGAIGLIIATNHKKANIGYWIGKPYWSSGYCTEAAQVVIDYAFDELSIHRIYARHMAGNPASGRVMEKIGMKKEGELVDDMFRDGNFHTMIIYGMINSTLRK